MVETWNDVFYEVNRNYDFLQRQDSLPQRQEYSLQKETTPRDYSELWKEAVFKPLPRPENVSEFMIRAAGNQEKWVRNIRVITGRLSSSIQLANRRRLH